MKNQFNLITGAKGYIAEQLSLEFNKKKIQQILVVKNSNKKKIYKIDLKNTEKYCKNHICLPLFYGMTIKQASFVVTQLKKLLQ